MMADRFKEEYFGVPSHVSIYIYIYILYFKYLYRLHEFQLHCCFTNCPVLKEKKNN